MTIPPSNEVSHTGLPSPESDMGGPGTFRLTDRCAEPSVRGAWDISVPAAGRGGRSHGSTVHLQKPHGELSLGWNLKAWKGCCRRQGGDKTMLPSQPYAGARGESCGQSKTVVWVTRCGGVEPTTSESAREGCGRQGGGAPATARALWRSSCGRVRMGRLLPVRSVDSRTRSLASIGRERPRRGTPLRTCCVGRR